MARHLFHWGYEPTVVHPKMEQLVAKNEVHANFVLHLRSLGIEPATEVPPLENFDIIVDCIFGFTFKGWRGGGKDAPFDAILEALEASPMPVVSVDVPSGWDVDNGPGESGPVLHPEMLVSFLAPKAC